MSLIQRGSGRKMQVSIARLASVPDSSHGQDICSISTASERGNYSVKRSHGMRKVGSSISDRFKQKRLNFEELLLL